MLGLRHCVHLTPGRVALNGARVKLLEALLDQSDSGLALGMAGGPVARILHHCVQGVQG